MTPLSSKKRWFYFIFFTVIFVLAVPAIILYATGYRYDIVKALFEKRGGIYVYSAEPGTRIYLDGEHEETTGLFNREFITKSLKEGRYHVRAEHDDFLPWEKFVDVRESFVTSLYPFLVPKELDLEEIFPYIIAGQATSTVPTTTPVFNEVYVDMLDLFALSTTTATTTVAVEVISVRDTSVWHENQKFFARWSGRADWMPSHFCQNNECRSTLQFLEVTSPIKNFSFYPGRDDVIIFSVDSGIFVAEIDTRPKQTVEEIYAGEDTDFRILSGREALIKDGEKLFRVEL